MLPFLEALAALDRADELGGARHLVARALSLSGADRRRADRPRREAYHAACPPRFHQAVLPHGRGADDARTAAMLHALPRHAPARLLLLRRPLISIPALVRWIATPTEAWHAGRVHCTGDAAGSGYARRDRRGAQLQRTRQRHGPVHHIAHAGFVAPADIRAFARQRRRTADAVPIIWYPGPIQQAIRAAVATNAPTAVGRFAIFHEAGALMAAGSVRGCRQPRSLKPGSRNHPPQSARRT